MAEGEGGSPGPAGAAITSRKPAQAVRTNERNQRVIAKPRTAKHVLTRVVDDEPEE